MIGEDKEHLQYLRQIVLAAETKLLSSIWFARERAMIVRAKRVQKHICSLPISNQAKQSKQLNEFIRLRECKHFAKNQPKHRKHELKMKQSQVLLVELDDADPIAIEKRTLSYPHYTNKFCNTHSHSTNTRTHAHTHITFH